MALKLSLSSDYDTAKEAAKGTVLSDGIVIYPTDTLYGLGCNALSEKAVAKVYGAKKREKAKPLSIIVADYKMLLDYCEVSSAQERILHSLLPGPYTFILKLRKKLPASNQLSIGVRVPEHMFMRLVAAELSLPIVSTSANLSGEKEAAQASEVDPLVAREADLFVDGGKCQYAKGSTVIDLIQMKIVRLGAVRQGDRFEF
ncbi:TPA: threonylcarbamoyl-AMP synthase [Candidatus Micrarchaeota archaeon]|nr:threonylcarbamoyl-AMP synthase [Candidatus Micrarchaeota archaeon]